MACPDCGNPNTLRSDYSIVHYMRTLYGSSKRYCLVCHKKWKIKKRSNQTIWNYAIPIFGLAASVVFMVDEMPGWKASFPSMGNPSLPVSPKLIEKAQQKLKQDPEALSKLSPAKKRMVDKALKRYGLSASDIEKAHF